MKRNKGLGKAFFSKSLGFVVGTTAYRIWSEFTLSQCRIGWCRLSNSLQIHILFVDVLIDFWTFNSKETAKAVINQKEIQ